ncbi:MAG: UDP-N-acetylglucosamine--N-acetylmuramyl-(pentapeptide) pyrophosphoryl-undecaprenol N-acetylglucosamine transferase [Candidatus Omnitrophica bacterium]|nr:UDP-N-acetylglucosamine--N-acetylmuramyl-(pentapeptide) pyrophosphoryl-undecaprenol N-acetylglucosamine transferase [Candidatus Omnitrophota bacterium]
MKVLLVCERSAGHIFPALSIGAKMSQEATVYFFATSSFLKRYIEKEGFVCIGKSFSFRCLIAEGIWRLFEALYFIIKLRPKKVIGFGGRDSFFLVLFSSLLGIDTAIYEPNLKIGRANRLLMPFVGKILRGFPGEDNKKSRTIGIPLRKNIKKIDKTEARKILNFNDDPVVFCLGGSQGSTFVNNIFVEFAREFKDKLQIIHLTGKDKYLEILPLYNTIKGQSFIKDFYYNVEVLYSAADLVVSRAGANALGEISFYQLPAILLPHPEASGHQKENALYLEKRGAAIVYLQDKFFPKEFKASLSELIANESRRQNIRNNLSKIRLGISYEDFSSNTYF